MANVAGPSTTMQVGNPTLLLRSHRSSAKRESYSMNLKSTMVSWVLLSFALTGLAACSNPIDDADRGVSRNAAQSDDDRDDDGNGGSDDDRDDRDDSSNDSSNDSNDDSNDGAAGAPTEPSPQAGAGCSLGAVTVENFEVPQGVTCTLQGTRVTGNLFVQRGGTLLATNVQVGGNLQAEGAKRVDVKGASTFEGSVQIKQGGSALVHGARINADLQFDSMTGTLSAHKNVIGGSLQAFQNRGGLTVVGNEIDGNLQCKENAPAPSGNGNVVQGNKEDQCASF
jgi:hypothetical protein